MTDQLPSFVPRPRPPAPSRKRHDPLPTRVITAVAGVAATLGLMTVIAPPRVPAATGTSDLVAGNGPDSAAPDSTSPDASGGVVETGAPAPVKSIRPGSKAPATAKPGAHAATGSAGGGATSKPGGPARTPKPTQGSGGGGANPTPAPTPRPTPAPKPTPAPTPRPTPVPTGASGKP